MIYSANGVGNLRRRSKIISRKESVGRLRLLDCLAILEPI